MKKLLLSFSAITLLIQSVDAQCTPVDCSADLPVYGGVCDTNLVDAIVGQPYDDFESFVLNSECFDAGLIDESQAGTNIRITNIDNFSYSGNPNGLSGVTSAASYQPPGSGNALGCVNFTGTPTEIGVFNYTMSFLADIVTCGFIEIPMNDNAADYVLWLRVLPVPTFSGLADNYCVTDGPVTLTPTGTTGGVFSGPGVTGSSFNPATAGVGTHTVKYVVSGQEGAAIAPASDSLEMVVMVFAAGTTFYQDADNDTYGDLNSTATGCTIPAGYVANPDDCDDADPLINPDATDIPDNGIDEDCSGADASSGITEIAGDLLTIYPNPTNGNLIISLPGITIQSVLINDLNGRIVETKSVNSNKTTCDLTSFKDGVYLVTVQTDKGSIVKRVVLQH